MDDGPTGDADNDDDTLNDDERRPLVAPGADNSSAAAGEGGGTVVSAGGHRGAPPGAAPLDKLTCAFPAAWEAWLRPLDDAVARAVQGSCGRSPRAVRAATLACTAVNSPS